MARVPHEEAIEAIRASIRDSLHVRNNATSPLQVAVCLSSITWINQHSRESVSDAFKPVRSWLLSGWEQRIGRKSKPPTRSVASL